MVAFFMVKGKGGLHRTTRTGLFEQGLLGFGVP